MDVLAKLTELGARCVAGALTLNNEEVAIIRNGVVVATPRGEQVLNVVDATDAEAKPAKPRKPKAKADPTPDEVTADEQALADSLDLEALLGD